MCPRIRWIRYGACRCHGMFIQVESYEIRMWVETVGNVSETDGDFGSETSVRPCDDDEPSPEELSGTA